MTQKRSPSLGDKLTQGAPLTVLLVLALLILARLQTILELIAIAILLSLIVTDSTNAATAVRKID